MIDVKKEIVEIQKLMMQTSEHVPKSSKEKFQQLKLLDEIENRCNMCWYATDDERFYALSETVERMAERIKDTLSQNEMLKYLMTDWWVDL